MSVRTYRDLIAWQRATDLVEAIYNQLARMHRAEEFGLTSQMKRAAIYIPSNIAEGHGRQSRQDYLRFLRNARGSLSELSTQYELATVRLKLIAADPNMKELLAEVDRILQGLIRSLERKRD